MKNVEARTKGLKDLVPVDDQKSGAFQVSNAASPTLHFSNPDLAKMVKDAQAAMFINTNPKTNATLVTLNTSVHEVPSQTVVGEQTDDSGYPLLSTGNNQHVEKGRASPTQSNSTNEKTSSKKQQVATSAIAVNRKSWAEQVEEEEEEDCGDSYQDITDEATQCSGDDAGQKYFGAKDLRHSLVEDLSSYIHVIQRRSDLDHSESDN
ncbi:uncharacterized protein LOC142170714 [Nicotiana tabacum]|uniref:Uncharacterized protein LOC142170714 n=2 Tax=Nicotiana tabacum TaxID=4097 RepID=A0AC58SVU1_TOBAC